MKRIEAIERLVEDADHVDRKYIESEVGLREFIAACLSYTPFWMRALYGVRWMFVRLLGMKQEGVPASPGLRPEEVSMTPGEPGFFFTVKEAQEESFWLAGISESHLTAHLGIVREELGGGRSRYEVITVVHYHKWTGPVYFNVIRPFHHLVVGQMVKAGAKGVEPSELRGQPWLGRQGGNLLMAIALLHTVVGLAIFAGPLADVLRGGLIGAVEPHYDRGLAVWFLLFGVVLFVLGGVVQWTWEKLGALPVFLGWAIGAMCLLGGLMMPTSGFWLGLPVSIGLLQMPSQRALAVASK